MGIPEEDQPVLFQSFVRLDSPLKTKVLGTGLGLYLTRKIVEEILDGEVFVESTPGQRSTFGLRIPLRNEAV
ncbi:MAG TPA: ATP-binding protein [Desulfobacteraceae bacterium]|nr:ATP-binding protein [Desulfobacteraceae bacterium]